MLYCKEAPTAGYAFKYVFPVIDGLDAGADDDVDNGPRNEHLARPRQGRNPGSYVNGHAADVVAANFDLSNMDTGPNL
jgi:hypothetical protein